MTIGDALPWVAFWGAVGAYYVFELYFDAKRENEKLRIRADLLKAGIDPDRLDNEGEAE